MSDTGPSVAEGASLRRAILHGPVARLAAGNFAVQGAGFLAGLIAARVLGVAGRGELAAVLLWPTVVAGIGTLGLDWALAVRAGREQVTSPQLIRFVCIKTMIVAPVLMLIGWGLIGQAARGQSPIVVRLGVLYLWMIPFHLLWLDLLAIDNALQRYGLYNATRVGVYALLLAAYVAIALAGRTELGAFVVANLLAVAAVVVWRLAPLAGAAVRGQVDGAWVRETLRPAGAFAAANAAMILFTRIDVIMVVLLLGARALGLYVVAQAVANIPSLFSQAFMVRTFGSTARADADAAGAFRAVVGTRLRQSLMVSAVPAAALIVAMPWVLRIVYGAEFAEGAAIGRLLAVASWLFNGGRVIDEGFRGSGRPQYGTRANVLFIVCVATVGPVLARGFALGGIGVAAAAVVGAVVALGAMLVVFAREVSRGETTK